MRAASSTVHAFLHFVVCVHGRDSHDSCWHNRAWGWIRGETGNNEAWAFHWLFALCESWIYRMVSVTVRNVAVTLVLVTSVIEPQGSTIWNHWYAVTTVLAVIAVVRRDDFPVESG